MNNLDLSSPESLYDFLISNQKNINFSNLYVGFVPDSHIHFHNHGEFQDLFRKFTKNLVDDDNIGDSCRLWGYILNCKKVIEDNIPGDFAEVGVWRGNTAAVLAFYAHHAQRKLYLFDTFTGFDKNDITEDQQQLYSAFSNTSLALVKDTLEELGDCCEYIVGRFPSSLQGRDLDNRYSIVNLDCDLYTSMKASLEFFYPRVNKGGIIFLHDYSSGFWKGAKQAIDEFCTTIKEQLVLMPDKCGTAIIKKI
jgi:Macrocin-O-methyltransferase (TylF)